MTCFSKMNDIVNFNSKIRIVLSFPPTSANRSNHNCRKWQNRTNASPTGSTLCRGWAPPPQFQSSTTRCPTDFLVFGGFNLTSSCSNTSNHWLFTISFILCFDSLNMSIFRLPLTNWNYLQFFNVMVLIFSCTICLALLFSFCTLYLSIPVKRVERKLNSWMREIPVKSFTNY